MNTAVVHHSHDHDSTDVFGFWVYILTDCFLFASLFATYLVLNHPGAWGPQLRNHIDLNYVLIETFVLLGSNFTYGLAMLSLNKNSVPGLQLWLLVTFILGSVFVGMELNEFIQLYNEGYSWSVSGGASSFFTLVGTHGLHVSFGLLWIAVLMVQLLVFNLNHRMKKRFIYLGLFWNFLDIIWIFLFSLVYLLGVL